MGVSIAFSPKLPVFVSKEITSVTFQITPNIPRSHGLVNLVTITFLRSEQVHYWLQFR
jgi:hypothetical protein